RIDDRSHFVLGWSNEGKIAALEKQARDLEALGQATAGRIAGLETMRQALQVRLGLLQKLAVFDDFRDLDWKPLATEIDRLERERRRLEEASDVLRALQHQLAELETAAAGAETGGEGDRNADAAGEERGERRARP